MRWLHLLYLGLTAVFAVVQWLTIATAALLDDLIAAARKEGHPGLLRAVHFEG